MKRLTFLLLLLALSGCAEYQAVRSGVAAHGADAADEHLIAAEWSLCNAISIGAWRRAYAMDSDRANAWVLICEPRMRATPAGPVQ